MAAFGGSFESANNIEDKKEYKRKARQEVLEKVLVLFLDIVCL